MTPELSFIIVEYNSLIDLRRFIDSLHPPLEQQPAVAEAFPGVTWVFNKENIGFAGAVNAGMSQAYGACMVIANADALFRNGSLSSAYRYLMKHPDVGIIGPKIIDAEGNIQDCCRRFMTPKRFAVRLVKRVLFQRFFQQVFGLPYKKLSAVSQKTRHIHGNEEVNPHPPAILVCLCEKKAS